MVVTKGLIALCRGECAVSEHSQNDDEFLIKINLAF